MKLLILEGLYGKMRGKKRQWRLKRTNLKVGDRVVLDCYDWRVIKVVEKRKKRVFWDCGVAYGDWIGNIDTSRGIKYVIEQVNKRKLKELRNRPYFKTIVTEVKGKPSRGENLGKIKFPCWCSYKNCLNEKCYGEMKKNEDYFEIIELKQDGTDLHFYNLTLKELIEGLDIEILKGELHLWREVAE